MRNNVPESPYNVRYDLNSCDKEPIHLIRTVQSFACLLVADLSDLVIKQLSSNVQAFLNQSSEEILGSALTKIFPPIVTDLLQQGIENQSFADINPIVLPITKEQTRNLVLVAHVKDDRLMLEIEESIIRENSLHFLQKVDASIRKIQSSDTGQKLFEKIVLEIKAITGYDRVMLYQFDKEYNGEVIAEAKEAQLEAYLGIRYPATDIPRQARALFLKNRVRMLIDVDDDLAFIQTIPGMDDDNPLDVGSCISRGMSPIHLEYLRNMGVKASLTVAVIEDNQLWGLIACHHYSKKNLDYSTRSLIKLLGQIISGHLSLFRAKEFREGILLSNIIQASLFENMNQEQDIVLGLSSGQYSLLDYISAPGAAIIFEGKITTFGQHPSEEQIWQIVQWLNQHSSALIYATNSINTVQPGINIKGLDYSGLLAVRITEEPPEYILWFRQSLDREVIWGGDPNTSITMSEETGRLSPRKSFAKWKEVIADRAEPWKKQEREAALVLRNNIKDILLKRFDELKKLHNDLQVSYKELESFSYTVSHDLRSPLRGIEGFAQILLEDYEDKLDRQGVHVINTIVNSVNKMNEFINETLSLARLAKKNLIYNEIDIHALLLEIKDLFAGLNSKEYPVAILIDENLPKAHGDHTMIKQLFANLVSNAIKYSRPIKEASLHISGEDRDGYSVYTVTDNGIGFDMKHANKIFEVFNRLVTEEEYEGSGVGLSIVKRVIQRHQGEIAVDSTPGQGTTFEIKLPKTETTNT